MCAIGPEGRTDFSALRSAMGRREAGAIVGDLKFYAFDCLSHGREDLRRRPLGERKEHLEALLFPGCEPLSPLMEYVDALPDEGEALLKAACGLGLEGIVSQGLDAPYTGGAKRLETWRKAKCRPSREIEIGGWETDAARLRPLLAGVYEGGAFRYVGSVGTAFPQGVAADLISEGEVTCGLFRFLTTDANAEVAIVQDKAMRVILTSPEEWDLWLSDAPWPAVKHLQRPLPDGSLTEVARGTEKTRRSSSNGLHRALPLAMKAMRRRRAEGRRRPPSSRSRGRLYSRDAGRGW